MMLETSHQKARRVQQRRRQAVQLAWIGGVALATLIIIGVWSGDMRWCATGWTIGGVLLMGALGTAVSTILKD